MSIQIHITAERSLYDFGDGTVTANAVRFSHDLTWAYVGQHAIYPREDGTFSIGLPAGGRSYRDIDTGFENMDAAIAHADFLVSEARISGPLEAAKREWLSADAAERAWMGTCNHPAFHRITHRRQLAERALRALGHTSGTVSLGAAK